MKNNNNTVGAGSARSIYDENKLSEPLITQINYDFIRRGVINHALTISENQCNQCNL